MNQSINRGGPAVVLEAVLHTEQLSDVREILQIRLGGVAEGDLWKVVAATNELVTNALVHAGRCTGLRVYLTDRLVRVEVDDPSPRRVPSERPTGGLDIVAGVATRWGDTSPGADAASVAEPCRVPAAKTIWCEIEI